ncbi:MAG: sodium-dependent transporter [Bacteroidales bacterium]|nr:sodium-dependent transporter [Bacteroidales bacterium]
MQTKQRDSFGSRFGVIAAAAGSAIGLGNIWRFPYVLGENGGGIFLLIYLVLVAMVGIPVMLSEFTIGRRARRNPYGAFRILAPGKPWYLVGLVGIMAAFMILAFYTVVAGWTLEYLYQAVINGFSGKSPETINNMFDAFRASTFRPILWFLIFMFMTAWIVVSGIRKGIEKYTKILMPFLFLLIIVLDIRAITLPGAGEGLKFLFKPDFSKISAETILEALGQGFFSLSIGMGTLITYGSYINKKEKLGHAALNVTLADTLIAILAGIAIFPAVFAFGIEPNEGTGLVFKTLPLIFQEMAGGYFFSILFFLLLAIAALTSTISVLEVIVAFFSEELKISRKAATILAALTVGMLGIMAAGSWGWFSGVQVMKQNFFGIFDFTTANILLPVGGFFIVIFVGWFMGTHNVKDELSNGGDIRIAYLPVFIFLVRYVAPLAIALVFMNGLGWI